MTQAFDEILLLHGGGCGEGAGCRASGGPWFRSFVFCLRIIMKITILNNIKVSDV